jgi:hypothetical protein
MGTLTENDVSVAKLVRGTDSVRSAAMSTVVRTSRYNEVAVVAAPPPPLGSCATTGIPRTTIASAACCISSPRAG